MSSSSQPANLSPILRPIPRIPRAFKEETIFLYDTIVRLARALGDLSVKKRGLPALEDLNDELFHVLTGPA
jgi:hypothetical protein